MDSNGKLSTPAVDLLVPADRFVSASRLYGRLHRWRLLVGKYWWVIFSILVLVLGPVFFLTYNSPPAYESKARMWLTGKLDISEDRLYTEELINYLGTQSELLRSPKIQGRALARLVEQFPDAAEASSPRHFEVLDTMKRFCKGLFEPRAATNGPADPPFPFKVKVLEASKSSIFELRAIGAEPVRTQAFLNYLMETYLSFKKEIREKTSDRTMASVAAQVTELAKELEAQQEKLHAFQSSNNVVFLQEQGNSAGSYLASLSKQLADLRTELRLLRLAQPEQWVEMK